MLQTFSSKGATMLLSSTSLKFALNVAGFPVAQGQQKHSSTHLFSSSHNISKSSVFCLVCGLYREFDFHFDYNQNYWIGCKKQHNKKQFIFFILRTLRLGKQFPSVGELNFSFQPNAAWKMIRAVFALRVWLLIKMNINWAVSRQTLTSTHILFKWSFPTASRTNTMLQKSGCCKTHHSQNVLQ